MSLASYSLRSAGRAKKKLLLFALVAAALALLADALVIRRAGVETPFAGDADFFASIARSVSSGHGYYLAKSPWPNQPDTSRSPLYPYLLSVTFRVFPDAHDGPASRYTDAFLHSLAAGLLVLLAYQISGSVRASGAAGAGLALYPPATALVMAGLSEIAFLAAMLLGIVLLLEGQKAALAGSLLCGLGVLARSNFLLLPFFAVLLLAIFAWRTIFTSKHLRRIALLCALFYVFPLLWMIRNYSVTGTFPLLSTMEGETFYGANNVLVANDLGQWGYWTLPDDIPGEQSKAVLAQTRSDLQLNQYYHRKALEFIKSNWPAVPRLELGKLIRGFVPLPWTPLAASYVVFGSRLLLYVAFFAALWPWRRKRQLYSLLLASIFLVVLTTTLIYYGLFRFTFCVEPFLFPVVAVAYAEWRRAIPPRLVGNANIPGHMLP